MKREEIEDKKGIVLKKRKVLKFAADFEAGKKIKERKRGKNM